MQPGEISPIDIFQRRVKQRVVGVHSCVRQLLPICNRRRSDRIGVIAHRFGYGVVQRSVAERESEGRGEESVRTVGWVRRVGTVREHVYEKRLKGECDGGICIQAAEFPSPELQTRDR